MRKQLLIHLPTEQQQQQPLCQVLCLLLLLVFFLVYIQAAAAAIVPALETPLNGNTTTTTTDDYKQRDSQPSLTSSSNSSSASSTLTQQQLLSGRSPLFDHQQHDYSGGKVLPLPSVASFKQQFSSSSSTSNEESRTDDKHEASTSAGTGKVLLSPGASRFLGPPWSASASSFAVDAHDDKNNENGCGGDEQEENNNKPSAPNPLSAAAVNGSWEKPLPRGAAQPSLFDFPTRYGYGQHRSPPAPLMLKAEHPPPPPPAFLQDGDYGGGALELFASGGDQPSVFVNSGTLPKEVLLSPPRAASQPIYKQASSFSSSSSKKKHGPEKHQFMSKQLHAGKQRGEGKFDENFDGKQFRQPVYPAKKIFPNMTSANESAASPSAGESGEKHFPEQKQFSSKSTQNETAENRLNAAPLLAAAGQHQQKHKTKIQLEKDDEGTKTKTTTKTKSVGSFATVTTKQQHILRQKPLPAVSPRLPNKAEKKHRETLTVALASASVRKQQQPLPIVQQQPLPVGTLKQNKKPLSHSTSMTTSKINESNNNNKNIWIRQPSTPTPKATKQAGHQQPAASSSQVQAHDPPRNKAINNTGDGNAAATASVAPRQEAQSKTSLNNNNGGFSLSSAAASNSSYTSPTTAVIKQLNNKEHQHQAVHKNQTQKQSLNNNDETNRRDVVKGGGLEKGLLQKNPSSPLPAPPPGLPLAALSSKLSPECRRCYRRTLRQQQKQNLQNDKEQIEKGESEALSDAKQENDSAGAIIQMKEEQKTAAEKKTTIPIKKREELLAIVRQCCADEIQRKRKTSPPPTTTTTTMTTSSKAASNGKTATTHSP